MRRVTAPSGGALSLEEKRGSFASCGFRSTWQRSLSDDWGTPEPGAWARASARLISESTSSPITCFSCLWRFCFRDFKYCESFYKVGWFLESHGTFFVGKFCAYRRPSREEVFSVSDGAAAGQDVAWNVCVYPLLWGSESGVKTFGAEPVLKGWLRELRQPRIRVRARERQHLWPHRFGGDRREPRHPMAMVSMEVRAPRGQQVPENSWTTRWSLPLPGTEKGQNRCAGSMPGISDCG